MPHFFSTSPSFPVADVDATIRWYQQYLGFDANPFPDHKPYVFALLYRENAEIMLQLVNDYEKPNLYARRLGGVWDAYFRVIGVQELYDSVRDKVEVLRPLQKMPYSQMGFEVKDLNGYVLVFSEEIEG